jgi:hypothetical protein
MKLNLISNGNTNAKTIKNESETYILYLSPYNLNSTGKNICPFASKGCAEACLNSAGRGAFSNVQKARQRKTDLFFSDPNLFFSQLLSDLSKINKKAIKESKNIFIRLNGTSDLDFDKLLVRYTGNGLLSFGALRFYDYTKDKNKAKNFARYSDNDIYRVTYSRKETDQDQEIETLLNYGVNVAVVFSNDLPNTYLNFPVVNGDLTDLRFNDPNGVVIGLKAKGKAKKDCSGFVVLS